MPEEKTPVAEVAEEKAEVAAPVTPEAEEADKPEEKAEEKPAEEKTEEEESPEDKRKLHNQRRWERLTKERAEFKARAEFYAEQVQRQQQTQQPASTEGRPTRDQFQDDESYVDALTEWKVNQKLAGVKQELYQTQQRTQQQTEWMSKITAARQEYPDYDEVTSDADIPIAQSVADAILSSEYGADIAYWLAHNPDKAMSLNGLSPVNAVMEVGRISSYIEYEKAKKKDKAPVSKAPNPIKPVKASAGSGTKSLEDMSPAEYVAYMNKREAERRKRH